MKKAVALAAFILLAAAALYLFSRPQKVVDHSSESSVSASVSNQAGNGSIPITNVPQNILTFSNNEVENASNTSMAARAAAVPPPVEVATNLSPAIVLDNVSYAIHQYAALFGGNPVGTNPEITSELKGGNARQINFIKPEAGLRISDQGELVDSWDTPLFFHQLSGTQMEIHSAGPDKVMWTGDDLIAR